MKLETAFRVRVLFLIAAVAVCSLAQSPTYTLTVDVEGVNREDGNIGVLVFNSDRGWPDDIHATVRNVVVPAHPGTVTVVIQNLPPGDYALAVGHDANKNAKVDKNFFGKPKEQWGMSNNPHATLRPPSFSRARFTLRDNVRIRVVLQ